MEWGHHGRLPLVKVKMGTETLEREGFAET